MAKHVIFDFFRTLYDPETESLYPSTRFVLEALAQKKYSLFLVTQDEAGRNSLLDATGIAPFFTKIKRVRGEKTPNDFLSFCENQPLRKKEWFVVGDRLRGEMRIGNNIGATTIWVRQGKFWQSMPESEHEKPDHTVWHIEEILPILDGE